MGSATNESKSSSLSSNDRRVCRQPGGYSSIRANNRGPDISIVDVLSHHCALPQPKKATRQHVTRTRNARGRGNMQAHTKIKIRKFLLRGLWPFIRNFAPTKISLYTVISLEDPIVGMNVKVGGGGGGGGGHELPCMHDSSWASLKGAATTA